MTIRQSIQNNVSLKPFNTFGIACSARSYLRVTNIQQLTEVTTMPRLVLGGGSNLILKSDYPGIVLHIALSGRQYIAEDVDFIYVRAAAGEVWHDFVQWTIENGWGGLENLSLIPGSIGAAPIQNIGAYGVEFKEFFHSLSWYEFATGKIHTFRLDNCQFAYRDSIFKNDLFEKGIITEVVFALPKQWQPNLSYKGVAEVLQGINNPTPKQISTAICAIRQSKLPDPKVIGNAGSFFKNPIVTPEKYTELSAHYPQLVSYLQRDGHIKLAAGWLIEEAGWRGHLSGRVGVHNKQALVLVNLGGARGEDVIALAKAIQDDVKIKFGVALEIEPVIV